MQVTRNGPWLVARFGCRQRALSWAVVGGGLVECDTVLWHQLRDADLPPGVDPEGLLRGRMAGAGWPPQALGLLTSASLDVYRQARHRSSDVEAEAVATVGLSNALCVGDPATSAALGTINVLAALSVSLSLSALVEAVSLVAEARTLAVLERGVRSTVSGALASGTGTDCIAVCCPAGSAGLPYAGKHTPVGEALGRAVLDAVRASAAAHLALDARRSGP